jgi:Family of unknown function (DUF6299)
MRRISFLVGLAVVLNLVLISPVLAQPTNDTFGGATVIGALPFSDTVDTTEATTDADDAEANTNCGAPATDASVWYEFTATEDAVIVVDVGASNYTAGIIVVTGEPDSFEFVTCDAFFVAFEALAGETYRILAFDFEDGTGGTLQISVDEAPPPPEISLTVDPTGQKTKSGSAIVSGTVTCTGENIEFTFIDVELQQRVGRILISGFGSIDFPCDGDTHEWSVEVFGENGLFKGGHAAALTFAVACDPFFCGEAFEEATVKLQGK